MAVSGLEPVWSDLGRQAVLYLTVIIDLVQSVVQGHNYDVRILCAFKFEI